VQMANPAFRLSVAGNFKPATLADLQARMNQGRGLCLQYVFGEKTGHCFVARAGGTAEFVSLSLNNEHAVAVGLEPGPLTAKRLGQLLSVDDEELPLLLSNPETADRATERLALLWTMIVPETARQALTQGDVKELVVIPDGALALLPLETLVVEPGELPKYLLDVGPPILYAPSATVLLNLTGRAAATPGAKSAAQPVLTVANPIYGTPKPTPAAVGSSLDALAARSRYGAVGGDLAPLPYTGTESAWVSDVYKKRGIASAGLLAGLATEANVRFNVPGRRVLHFACHGLADQAYGNFFGALALTPGKQASTSPADDGFLTLPEINELDLKSCELAILSACETNYGPQQQGEGVWALSRGFLVAGARRVVASNWLVDDEAAASLISYFCAGVAKDQVKGESPDHAKALHDAKRWVRGQEKWASPYYWGTFVLVGPN
jgi:CHAT domain-containing protein